MMAAKRTRCFAIACSLVATGAIRGAPLQDQQPFRSETDLVSVTATVLNRNNQAVVSLTQSDFTVLEDGTPQQIAFFSLDDRTPVSLAVVVDVSGSMEDKLDDAQDALRHLVNMLKEDDEIALLRFDSNVEPLTSFGARRTTVIRTIDNLSAGGGTALYDAVIEGLRTLDKGENRKKALLVVTDGNDTSSRAKFRDVTAAVTRSEAIVYGFGIGHGARGSFGHDPFGMGDTVDIKTLKAIAEPSGGRAELLENAHSGGVDLVDRAVMSMTAELGQQYTLGYYPSNSAHDGTYRRLTVTTANRDLVVRARKGYQAPAK